MSELPALDAQIERLRLFLTERLNEDLLAVDIWDDDPETFDIDNPPAGWFWPPDRIRTDIATKRQIVRICSQEDGQFGALIWLAQVYSDHEDFDPLWTAHA